MASAARSPLLVLWDVDHTLIENSGVSKATYAATFEMLTGCPGRFPPVTEGRTDQEIMRSLFQAHGLYLTDEYHARLPDVLTSALNMRIPALRQQGYVLPGAREALIALRSVPGVVQSVLTGNIQANARAKLAAFGLDTLLDLDVGGYGWDAFARANLVEVALSRAAAKYGLQFDKRSTILIGDTPRDVEAGRDGGAHVIAVATGLHSTDDLAEAEAVLADLRDTAELVAAVVSIRSTAEPRQAVRSTPPKPSSFGHLADPLGPVEAAELAAYLLDELGDRWMHVREVGAQARRVAPALPEADGDVLITAAYLHDVGYAPDLVATGFHPLDGARWLRDQGVDERLCTLVANHSCAMYEADERGLRDHLVSEFPAENSVTADALIYADMTVGPTGSVITFEERLADIFSRYPEDHVVHKAIMRAAPALGAAVRRTVDRLAASD